MTAHSYHYHHRCIPRFERAGWNPRWCKCQNYPNTLSLRLWNLSNCIPHPCHTYIRCLNTLNSCGWGYGSTLIPLPTDVSPDLGKFSEIIYDVNVKTIPIRYGWGCRTFQTASHICHTCIRCLNTLNSCGWAYGSTLTPLPPQTYPQIWESLLKS